MGKLPVLALRIVLVMVLAGSLFVQVVMVPLMAVDLKEDYGPAAADARGPVILIVLLGILCFQITALCIWRLLTMVRRGTVFSSGAFRFVDVIIGASAAAAMLTFALGVVLAPGEAAAPGVVLLIGGVAVVIGGIALVVLVMRMLLAQAVARDAEAHHLRSELDEVI